MGGHPHAVQPAEIVIRMATTEMIVYSMGWNFLFQSADVETIVIDSNVLDGYSPLSIRAQDTIKQSGQLNPT